ncbi:hypothetical protein RND81_08G184200 [Saponaria officinalis]|uniref:Uncharacterized protein n=1 Tax=Saponaria officinalis TaxID=3572 RepID=A0AAW1J910_SAPOF
MSTMKGNIIVPKKEQRPCPKPKKAPKQEEEPHYYNYKEGYYYNGRYYGPPRPLRLVPYLPWRKAWVDGKGEADEEVEEEGPPRVDGKTKSLIKRLNKSPNSVLSKERTQYRDKSRKIAQVHHMNYVMG